MVNKQNGGFFGLKNEIADFSVLKKWLIFRFKKNGGFFRLKKQNGGIFDYRKWRVLVTKNEIVDFTVERMSDKDEKCECI